MLDSNFDLKYNGQGVVVGVDEAGRGPWAGPVVAGAVILDIESLPEILCLQLDDSKKLTAQNRQNLYQLLTSHAQIGIGISSVVEIDSFNILQATMLAMKRAVKNLNVTPGMVLVDGNFLPDWTYRSKAIIKGDGKSLSIAAASVIAKVRRDQIMTDLARDYPHYGWESNYGYGTKIHQQGLAKFGICKHHRHSFKPIKKCLISRY